MKLRVDTALSSQAFTTTQPQLLAQVPDYNRTGAFLSNPDLLMESSKKTLKNKREEARKQRQGAMVIRGTWPSSEKHFSSCRFSYVTMALGGGVRLGQRGGEPDLGRVSAIVSVVVGPARWWGWVGLVVKFAERCGIVGGGVDVCLLERCWVEIGSFIWQQVVFIQCLK